MVDRYVEAAAAVARGWALTPLRGKIPQVEAWQAAAVAPLGVVTEWLDAGYNLGLRTGAASGVLAIDVDDGGVVPPGLPRTVTVRTGSGKAHYYFRHVEGIGNSASKLAPHVDVRGEGGQVVFVGSVHPDTKAEYAWTISPAECELAQLPERYVGMLRAKRVDMTASIQRGWHAQLLLSQVSSVRRAPEGEKHNRLNRAAYTLGGCMDISEEVATAELVAAALMWDCPEAEARRTVRDGFNAGRLVPMRERALVRLPLLADTSYVKRDTGEVLVLVPGSHYVSADKWQHITTDWFAASCAALLPDGLVCRRGGLPGVLQGPRGGMSFEPLTHGVTRIMLDRHLRFAVLKEPEEGDQPGIVRKFAVHDYAEVFLAGAKISESVPTLEAVVHWPTLLPSGEVTTPGWGASGVYYDEPLALRGCEPIRDAATREALLRDLIADFPLASEGDIEAVWAMLLTPLVRVAIQGPAPLFLVTSPQERTGKTKLVELVLGLTVLGSPVPATQLGSTAEEHDKRLISLLLCGASVVHLDNLSEYLDSAPLASLVTSHVYQARILGRSAVVSLPNHLTLVATGNNPRLSGELANRAVHIRLQTSEEDPARRVNFRHPDLPGWIAEERPRLMGALVGMILDWIDGGRLPGSVVMGGFEGWARTVGGILACQARAMGRVSTLLQEAASFVREQDDRQADLKALVGAWRERGGLAMKPAELLSLARELELFTWIEGRSPRAEQTAFGALLAKANGRIVSGMRLYAKGSGSWRKYCLERGIGL